MEGPSIPMCVSELVWNCSELFAAVYIGLMHFMECDVEEFGVFIQAGFYCLASRRESELWWVCLYICSIFNFNGSRAFLSV